MADRKKTTKKVIVARPAEVKEDDCIVEMSQTNKIKDLDPVLITNILKDRYHNGLSVDEIKSKYSISQRTWTEVNKKYKEPFVKKFGNKKNTGVSVDEMNAFWESNM